VDLAILPDSSKAFVACSDSKQVGVVDLRTPAADLLAQLDVGQTPIHIAVKPDGGEVFVCNYDGSSISEIITGSNEVNNTFLIGDHPAQALVSSDNALLYVSNFGSDSVAVYSIDNGKRTGFVNTGTRPEALAISPNQLLLLVVNTGSGSLSVFSLIDRNGRPLFPVPPSLQTMIPLGDDPRSIAVKAFISQR
jgi:DNA-binding beta-propeller fold protein YncE